MNKIVEYVEKVYFFCVKHWIPFCFFVAGVIIGTQLA